MSSKGEETEAKRVAATNMLHTLVGKNHLQEGFYVQLLTEVYRTNEDGRKSFSIGFFKDSNLAKVFARQQVDANWHEIRQVFVLTDDKFVFELVWQPAPIFDNNKAELKAREKALAKLTPEERKLIGL